MNLTDEEIYALAAQAEEGYDYSQLIPRGRTCAAGGKVRHPAWGDEDWRCTAQAEAILALKDEERVILLCREHFDFMDGKLDEEEGK